MKIMRSGANRRDQNQIKAYAEQGKDADEISKILRIHKEAVLNFMPKSQSSQEVQEEKPQEE